MTLLSRSAVARLSLFLAACLLACLVHGEEDAASTQLYDTGAALAGTLTSNLLGQKSGWQQVPEDTVQHRFKGDAVLLNEKLVVVLKRQGPGAEVYSKMVGPLEHRATLGHAQAVTGPLDTVQSLQSIQNTAGGVTVAVRFTNAPGLRFRLTTGESILEIQSDAPEASSGFVEAQLPSAYTVVPDYFGDDLVYGSEAFRGVCLPAENFCLSLLKGGDSMVMSVWQSSGQETWLSWADAGKGLCASRTGLAKDKRMWLALLETPGIWQSASGLASANWKPPFPAKWRASLVRNKPVADSWDMETGARAGQIAGQHEGPLVVYPIDRTAATPITASCPTDVMRNTLGVGPCQYILACEGLGAQGDPTPNSVMGWVEKQFEQKKDRKAASDIKERLDFMVQHVTDARAKIERYAQAVPQFRRLLASSDSDYSSMVADLERTAATGLTPDSAPERARQMAAEVVALVGKPKATAACQKLGEQLRALGAVQDHALARCRMEIRRLRQQSRTLLAGPTTTAKSHQQVQQLAEQILQSK